MFNCFSNAIFILLGGLMAMLGISESAFGASTTPDTTVNYDCAFALAEGAQSIRSVTLTEEVHRCFQFDNYADLAVVNAAHKLVPFSLSAPAVNVNRQRYTKDIEFYQEPDASSYRTGDQIRRIAALTGVVSSRISDKQWQESNIHYSSIILEQPKRDSDQSGDKLLSIALEVSATRTPIRATVLVEVSNDLQNWKILSKPHNFYYLPGKSKDLSSNGLSLSNLELSRYLNRDAKYFRLATLSNVEGFTTLISNINGTYEHTNRTTPVMQWLTVEPYKLEGEKDVWQFDLPSLIPVSALKLSNADNIVYYQGVVSSERHTNPNVGNADTRKSGKRKLKDAIKNAAKGKSKRTKTPQQWRTVTRFNRYKLLLKDSSVESPDLSFSSKRSHSWRIKFQVPADLSKDQLPKLELGWTPPKLTFVAQGAGPFRLLAGRDHATQKVGFPAQLRSLESSSEKVSLLGPTRKVSSEEDETLQNSPRQEPVSNSINWGKLALWSILLLGVSLMLYMAYKLMSTMKKES